MAESNMVYTNTNYLEFDDDNGDPVVYMKGTQYTNVANNIVLT